MRRAEVDKWAEWSKLNIALTFTAPVFWRVVRTAPSKRNQDKIGSALTVLSGFLEAANSQLASTHFLTGSELALSDIQFGHCLYQYYDIDIDRPDHPFIRRYYDNLCERAAFRDHVMVSYEELREVD